MTNVQEINNKIRIEGHKIAEKLKITIKALDCPIAHSTKTSDFKDVSSHSWITKLAKSIKKHAEKRNNPNTIDYDFILSCTIEKCNKQLDLAKKEWDNMMDNCKTDIQAFIQSSNISEDKKNEYMSYTYYPETLDISTLELIDTFDNIAHDKNFSNTFSKAKDSFAEKVAESVIKTVDKQINEYANINI